MRRECKASTVGEIAGFLRWHWPHVLVAVPGALLVTVLHEAAHAAAVVAQGGRLIAFTWLPSAGHWGQVEYDFPADAEYCGFAISVAPYCLWVLVSGLAVLLSFRGRPYRPWTASGIFVWVFLVPLADIANTAFPFLQGGRNDFLAAFGLPSASAWALTVLATLASVWLGFGVQARLYRERALSGRAYTILAAATLAGILAVSCRGIA